MKRILVLTIIGFLCFSMISVLTPEVMGWAGGVPGITLHGKMAEDALKGLGWTDAEIDSIPRYADEVDIPIIGLPHPGSSNHRVEEYQEEFESYGGNACSFMGAEKWALGFIKVAYNAYASGNEEEGKKNLGYAIHYIQDAFCPPHVFPFAEKSYLPYHTNPSTDFETFYTLPQYSKWQSLVSSAPIEPIASASDLESKIKEGADQVYALPCSYLRQWRDGEIPTIVLHPDHSLDQVGFKGWHMTDENIGQCMKKAASLVKGAATWAHALAFDAYHSYSEIESGLRSLESSGIAKVESIGLSVEGRQIWAIKISDEPSVDDQDEPDVLFVGLHHAREWISAEVPYYLAVNLVQNYDSDSTLKALIDNSEIWIVPVVNPDGLEYSRTYDRDWRKNRRDNGDGTFGVDLNRNYGYMWGLDSGSSGVTSAPDYRGPYAFSEPETIAIRDLISDPSREFQVVLSYHSYSQLILYPWGYTDESAPDSSIMSTLATEMSDLIRNVNGETYTPEQASQLYLTSGDLTDWVYGTRKVPAFTIELRPEWWQIIPGFELPESQIIDTCEENWPAALYLIRWVVLSQGGFMDFEDGIDEVPIRSTIPGMMFTTTMGYDWVYGDIRTGKYNVNPYGSRYYECHGNFFAWLGPNQGSGRIDFVGATAKSVSMLTSTYYGTQLDAYDSLGNLVANDYAGPNTQTGTMSEIAVSSSSIACVIVHDTGNYWLIDDLRVRDLLRETSAFQPPDSTSMFQTLDTIDEGTTFTYEFTNDQQQTLKILLNWQGSQFGIQVFRPDETMFCETESDSPPIRIVIPIAEAGTWRITVTALDVPFDNYPFALDVASLPLPADNIPPTTTLNIDEPKFVDSLDNIYITSATPLTMTAEDNPGGTGVASTFYRVYNSSYDTGWLEYSAPFYLTGFTDGEYSIDYYSTDNIGNTEPTITATVILDNTPPTITLTIGEPKYVSDKTYVTPDTPFTLEATDTGSGVNTTAYRIYSATYDSGWQTYTAPFKLTSLTDGTYTIEYNSTDNVQNTETTHAINVTLFSWNYIYQDTYGRGTTLKINLAHKFFQFITPDKDYGIRKATYMKQCGRAIIIQHCDSELRLITVAVDTKLDFCYAMAWDTQTRKCYFLIDKAGIEK